MEYHNVRALQVELWENCDNNCPFCYLRKDRTLSTPQYQLRAIRNANDILDSLPPEFDAFGLIGGEFFNGQLSDKTVKEEFIALVNRAAKLAEDDKIKQVWITASLTGNLNELLECLQGIKDRNKVFICTSYDTIGRFSNENVRSMWFSYVKQLKEMGFTMHTQAICTQAFVNEALNTDILRRLSEFSMFDFKCPGPFRADYLNSKHRDLLWYRTLLNHSIPEFHPHFFIEDRSSFIRFLYKIYTQFGPEKLAAFCSNEVRSDTVHLLPINKVVDNRWESDSENAPCGHPWDSFCYINSDKCARCDAIRILDDDE